MVPCGDADGAFWHLVTAGVGWSPQRWLDPGRCATLGRVWDLLERFAAGNPRACWWREREGRHKTIVVAPLDLSLVVVLREHRSNLLLLTAYPLGRRHAANLLRKGPGRMVAA